MPLLLYLFFLQRIFPGQLIPQAVVDALFRQQLVVGAGLLDTLCAQHKDTVVVLDGGQAVGNGQGGAAMGQLSLYTDLMVLQERKNGRAGMSLLLSAHFMHAVFCPHALFSVS